MSSYLDGFLGGAPGYSKLTAAFTQPALNATVTVAVQSTAWAIAGVGVNVAVGGAYLIVSVPTSTSLVLRNIGGTNNAAPATTVPSDGVIAPGGLPGAQGTPGAPIPVTTVITSNVANLAAAPSANDGYTFVNGDVVPLGGQTTTSQNGLYTYAAGVLTLLNPQPPAETLLRSTKGTNYANQLYSYQTGAIVPQQSNAQTIQGAYTTITIAPDGLGLALLGNEAVPRQSITNDAAFHDVWSFDMPGRGYTTGRLKVVACCWAVDGAKESEFNLRANVTCSASPTAGAVPATTQLDNVDDGLGPYGDMRFFIVGTALKLQIKNTQGAAIKYVGFVGLGVGAP